MVASQAAALAIHFLFYLYFPAMTLCANYTISSSSVLCTGSSIVTSPTETYSPCTVDNGNQMITIYSDDKKFVLGTGSGGVVELLMVNHNATEGISVWKFPVWYPKKNIDDWAGVEVNNAGNVIFFDSSGLKYDSLDYPQSTLLPNQTLEKDMRLTNGKFYAIVEHNEMLVINDWKTIIWTWKLNSCNSSDAPKAEPMKVLYTGTELQLSNECARYTLATTSESKPALPYISVDPTSGKLVSYKYDSKEGNWIEDLWLPYKTTRPLTIDDPKNQKCDHHYGECDTNGRCKCVEDQRQCKFFTYGYGVAQSNANGTVGFLYTESSAYDLNFRKPQNDSTSEGCRIACLQLTCSECRGFLYDNQSTRCFFISHVAASEFSVAESPTEGHPFYIYTTELVLVIPVAFMIMWTAAICVLAMAGRKLKFNPAQEIESLLASTQGLPQRFSYTTLATATMGFSEKLGSGGYGSVFKGVLTDKRAIAVKKLDSSGGTQGAKQFVTEVAGMGGISHVNVVKLCGFCIEAATTQCLLVYEFMPNGSLDKWLFENEQNLTWQQRVSIALGTAQGLLYLHEESSEPILHLDIKPQNILLDERFTAKLADFGMAKLLENRDITQVHTCMRGTPGYMAPEWLTHFTATKKSDVFSYGMVLLEIIGGRKNVDLSKIKPDDNNADEDEDDAQGDWYFPAWVVKQVREGNILAVVDKKVRVTASENFGVVKMMVQLALWCIQGNPGTRPTMQTVVQVLQGHLELGPPPMPTSLASSDTTSASMTDSSWNSHLKMY